MDHIAAENQDNINNHFAYSLTSVIFHPTGPFQPKTPHQILLVKLTFLPQKHIPYCPNRCGIEGGC